MYWSWQKSAKQACRIHQKPNIAVDAPRLRTLHDQEANKEAAAGEVSEELCAHVEAISVYITSLGSRVPHRTPADAAPWVVASKS